MLKTTEFKELVLRELMPKALKECDQIKDSLPNEKEIATGDKNDIRNNLRKSSLLVFIPALAEIKEQLATLIKLGTTERIMKNLVSKNDETSTLNIKDINLLIDTNNTLNDILFNFLVRIYSNDVQELENSMDTDTNTTADEVKIQSSDQLLDILIELGLKGKKRK